MPSNGELSALALAGVCSDVAYGYTESATTAPVGPRFLRITDIQGGRFDWSNVPYCTASAESAKKYALQIGDIVVARTGNSTGENAQVWALDGPAVFASYLIRFRVDPKKANPFFVGYQLRTQRFRDYVMAVRGGSAQPGANAKQLGGFELLLPERSYQDETVEVLRELDRRIDLLRQTNTSLESIAQALFKSWFIDFDPVRTKAEGREPEGMDAATAALFPAEFEASALGLIPKGWAASSLGALCKAAGGWIQTGPFGSQLHASDYLDAGIPVVMPQDMKGRRVSEDRIARVSQSNADRLSKHKLEIGDIVFSRRGDVGRHATVSEREVGWLCGTGCLLVRPGPQSQSPAFLSQALAYPLSIEWLQRHAVGATMPNLNTGILEALPLLSPVPEVLKRFEELVGPLERRITLNDAHTKTLEEVRDAVLPRLIAGTLTVPNAEVRAEEVPA
ncbi:hypothetical protein CDN99_04140 [Roseateles aquatilis]|uniref:Type I restriction modification DNA specificity domain-containing protein n=1 Tax=Roseateles aquatilis TaxID=431061 RepID=A0A246JM47_9BURK|nr:restriction endonuclease subunit S [Roseateles aquatilis]OWQ93655.1 hypothetical protein CDN99_04140 [Roseateles aquatilis]